MEKRFHTRKELYRLLYVKLNVCVFFFFNFKRNWILKRWAQSTLMLSTFILCGEFYQTIWFVFWIQAMESLHGKWGRYLVKFWSYINTETYIHITEYQCRWLNIFTLNCLLARHCPTSHDYTKARASIIRRDCSPVRPAVLLVMRV